MRFMREAGLAFDLAAVAGSSVIAGAIVGGVNLWHEIGVVAQFSLALGLVLLCASAIAVLFSRWNHARRGWMTNSRLQMKADAFGHGLIMAIRGPEMVGNLECRISGPNGLRFRSADRIIGSHGDSDREQFHFPGEFVPRVEPFPPAGRYMARWSGLISIEDEANPFNEERVPLGRETFRIDQFGGIHTKKRDRSLDV